MAAGLSGRHFYCLEFPVLGQAVFLRSKTSSLKGVILPYADLELLGRGELGSRRESEHPPDFYFSGP